MADKTVMGKITQIVGAVLDVKFKEGELPEINEAMIVACINETGIDVVNDYVKEFILNGQKIVKLMLSEE